MSSRYLHFSRTPYYGVVAALPLLILYEVLMMGLGWSEPSQVRNAGDVWLRMLLASLDISASHATLAMILIVILAIPLLWQREVTLEVRYFLMMFVESFFYSVLLGFVINIILAFIFTILFSGNGYQLAINLTTLAVPGASGPVQGLALSLGAGLFEEFIFRVVLLGILLSVTRLILANWLAAGVSIVLASMLFAAAHYVGSFGDPFTLASFLFRFVAGMLFTGLYYARGFAVVAYTHALYDIRVILF